MRSVVLAFLFGCATERPYVRMQPADNYEPYVRKDARISWERPCPPAQDDEVLWYPVPGCLKECVVPEPEPTATDTTPESSLRYEGP